jgi:hypothetical protein
LLNYNKYKIKKKGTRIRPKGCPINCETKKLGDSVCDPECYSLECHYDGLDCYSEAFPLTGCSANCTKEMLLDNFCSPYCDIFECGFDLGVCKGDTFCKNCDGSCQNPSYICKKPRSLCDHRTEPSIDFIISGFYFVLFVPCVSVCCCVPCVWDARNNSKKSKTYLSTSS